jgi:hypothetical protein
VRDNRAYLEPEAPFGWIDDPAGVNRLIGLGWLSTLFYPEPTHEETRGMVCEFYDRFYRVRLTNAQLNGVLEPAGIPRPEPPRPIGSPLTGIGAAPGAIPAPPTDFGTAPNAMGTLPALPPELANPRGRPSSSRTVPVIPGTEPGIPGVPNAPPLPALPDQPDALCTIPGVASPIAGLTGPAPLSPAPGGRIRQPGAGGAFDTVPSPGLPPNPRP